MARTASVFDLKEKLHREFGLATQFTKVYEGIGRWTEVEDPVFLVDIPEADFAAETILTVVHTGKPTMPLHEVLRDPLNDIAMAPVRFVNSSEKAVPWNDWSYEDPAKFDLDDDRLAWPIYRDWTHEAAHLSQIITSCRI